jgi:O-antigen/teichoic acid export membrane protein
MRNLLNQAFTILFARGFIRLSQFAAFLVLARFMSPEAFGWFGIFTSAIGLATLLGNLGLRQSAAFYIGQNVLTSGEAGATLLFLLPFLSAIGAVAVLMVYPGPVLELSTFYIGFYVYSGILGSLCLMMLQGVFLGRGDVKGFSLSETAPKVLLALMCLSLFLIGPVSLGAALGVQAASFILAIPFIVYRSFRGEHLFTVRFDLVGRMIGYGIPYALNLFLILFSARISMFALEHVFDSAAAGQFFAASRINEIFLEAATAFGLVLFSQAVREEEGEGFKTRNARIACWIFWFFAGLGAVICLVATPLVTLLVGSAYGPSGTALQILGIGLGPAAACKIIYPTMAGKGRPWFGTPMILVSLVINLAAAALLVPRFGVSGGAMAMVCGQVALYLGYVRAYMRIYHVPMGLFFVPQRSDLAGVWQYLRTRFS